MYSGHNDLRRVYHGTNRVAVVKSLNSELLCIPPSFCDDEGAVSQQKLLVGRGFREQQNHTMSRFIGFMTGGISLVLAVVFAWAGQIFFGGACLGFFCFSYFNATREKDEHQPPVFKRLPISSTKPDVKTPSFKSLPTFSGEEPVAVKAKYPLRFLRKALSKRTGLSGFASGKSSPKSPSHDFVVHTDVNGEYSSSAEVQARAVGFLQRLKARGLTSSAMLEACTDEFLKSEIGMGPADIIHFHHALVQVKKRRLSSMSDPSTSAYSTTGGDASETTVEAFDRRLAQVPLLNYFHLRCLPIEFYQIFVQQHGFVAKYLFFACNCFKWHTLSFLPAPATCVCRAVT